jgi:hypothetical protein
VSNDFQYLAPNGVGQSGTVEGGIQQIPFRNDRDATLSGFGGFVPGAEQPDGYLGTIQSRREDRLLDKVKSNLGDRQYQRGVHVGERIDPSSYFWPTGLQPDRGLARQAQGVPGPNGVVECQRQAPMGTPLEQMTAQDQDLPLTPRGRMRPPPASLHVNTRAREDLRAMSPTWR